MSGILVLTPPPLYMAQNQCIVSAGAGVPALEDLEGFCSPPPSGSLLRCFKLPPSPLTGHFRPTIRCNLGFTYQSVCLSLYLSVSLPVSLPVYLSVRLSVCVYEYENAWLSVINGDTSATLLHKIKSEQ